MKRKINIMTSCDENLTARLSILLQSIADNLPDRQIDFFLLQSRVPKDKTDILERQCSFYGNITFHNIQVPDPEEYEELAESGSWDMGEDGGVLNWCGEAYYSLGAYRLLPPDAGRVLYLDAGDTLVTGGIDPYYFGDFEGKSLMVTGGKYRVKDNRMVLFDSDDLLDREMLSLVVHGLFNSGSYVMNLDRMRSDNCSIQDYIRLAGQLKEISSTPNRAYLGDQGLLSAAYTGDLKYFGYPEIANLWYMPYNFCMWYFDRMTEMPPYRPAIIHYAGAELAFKPWRGKYPIFLERFQDKDDLNDLNLLKLGQAEYFYQWHEYAMRTEETLKGCR